MKWRKRHHNSIRKIKMKNKWNEVKREYNALKVRDDSDTLMCEMIRGLRRVARKPKRFSRIHTMIIICSNSYMNTELSIIVIVLRHTRADNLQNRWCSLWPWRLHTTCLWDSTVQCVRSHIWKLLLNRKRNQNEIYPQEIRCDVISPSN